MPGGLLNIAAVGNLNIILNGNPSKTFFKSTYAKYTNFGLQKFRIDYQGLKTLRLTDDSVFSFSIKNHGDLLMDTYFCVNLPDIYSPIYSSPDLSYVQPYEFKWIENIGCNLIRKARLMIDGLVIQEFTGQYLYNMIQRDFSAGKKRLVDEMTGNTVEFNDPTNYSARNGNYPSASTNNYGVNDWPTGPDPSIRGRALYVPLNLFSSLISEMALPLVALEYNKVVIEITCRPVCELFVIRDVSWLREAALQNIATTDASYAWQTPDRYTYYNPPYIAPDFNNPAHQMFYFLHAPPYNQYYVTGTPADINSATGAYLNIGNDWEQNIYLLCNYAFLDEQERKSFAGRPQSYLIKQVHEATTYNVIGTQRAQLDDKGLIVSWMWNFQRTDVNLRNEWTNFSNWEYSTMPYPCVLAADLDPTNPNAYPPEYPTPGLFNTQTHSYTKLFITGPLHIENAHNIMTSWGLLIDGKVRETTFDGDIVNYTEKYIKTVGHAKSGIYCYNFCLTTDPFSTEPTGAINLSKFTNIEFEYSTILPFDLAYISQQHSAFACVSESNGESVNPVLGVDKPEVMDYLYRYNLHIMQERYNMLSFENGMARLLF